MDIEKLLHAIAKANNMAAESTKEWVETVLGHYNSDPAEAPHELVEPPKTEIPNA